MKLKVLMLVISTVGAIAKKDIELTFKLFMFSSIHKGRLFYRIRMVL